MLLISGIYRVPYLDFARFDYMDTAGLAFIKRVLFVCLMAMLGSTLRWREAIGTKFTLLCGIWVLIHLGLWLLHREHDSLYFQRLVQIAFVWVFVNYVLQRREVDRKPFFGLLDLFYPPYFAIVCLLVILCSFNLEFGREITLGFGGNSFGFSIWLSQFVFLTFFVSMNLNNKSQSIRNAIVCVTPILMLQIFTGGRAGLFASLLIFIYFSYQHSGFRVFVWCAPYLAAVLYFSRSFSDWIGQTAGINTAGYETAENIALGGSIGVSIFRVPPINNNPSFHGYEFLNWLDALLSYRLTIMDSALSRIDFSSLYGLGVNNFMGSLPSGEMNHVHNIYIRALGELGVVGFVTLIAIMILPFRKQWVSFFKQLVSLGKSKSVSQKNTNAMLFYISVVILVGMLHSEFITTALSTCLLFWLCYAETLRAQAATNLGGS
jgi:O-antigen ligase